MKTLMYLFLVVILVTAGCAKDEARFENPTKMELKKAKVPIPIKGETWADPDMQSATRLIVGGTCTHTGKIDSEKSYYDFYTQVYIEVDGLPFVDLTGFGKTVAANGDSFEFTFITRQSLTDGTLASKAVITPESGTGKFKGGSGSFNTVGGYDVSGAHLYVFTIEGEMVFE
jgi:hypothetical protein